MNSRPEVLGELLAQAAHFRRERGALAPHLAERAFGQQHAQIRLAPVDQPELDTRGIVTPGGEVVLVERFVGQRAGQFRIVHRQTQLLCHLGAGKPAAGEANRAVDHDVLVVLGEALDDAVVARDQPAAAQGRNAGIELGLQGDGNGAHGVLFLHPPLEGEGRRALSNAKCEPGWGDRVV